jgi:hypothetical protein
MTTYSRDNIVANLNRGYCSVTFTKVNSFEQRTMVCTRNADLIPGADAPVSGEPDPGFGAVRVYEKLPSGRGQWRSFYPESVLNFLPGV